MTNAVLTEAGSAHVEELSDPYLMWFWNSNARSTAIVLNSLVNAAAGPEDVRPIVRWLMAVRRNGRWGNTQENAYAMESLVAYYRAIRVRGAGFHRRRHARRRDGGARAVQGALDAIGGQGAADGPGARGGARRIIAAADVRARRRGNAVLYDAAAVCVRRAVPAGARQRHPRSSGRSRRTSRTAPGRRRRPTRRAT